MQERVTAVSGDVLGFRRHRRLVTAWLVGLGLALLITFIVSVGIGSVPVPARDTISIVSHHLLGTQLTVDSVKDTIVWDIRVPRAVLGIAVGAGLSVAGAILQTLVRNMLADPYIIGINGGASTGAALAILFGAGAAFGDYALQGSAFLGAIVASFVLYGVARSQGRLTSIRLLMAGVAMGYALSAVTSFLIFASGDAEGARSVMFWLLGSLGLAKWDVALAISVIVVIVCLTIGIVWGAQPRCPGNRRRDSPHRRH